MNVREELIQSAAEVEAYLDAVLSDHGDAALTPIFDAMRYSALAGGKRIRPFLTLAFCELFGGERKAAIPFAAAVEMIHTYSLIHDDLPCMDDDDLRRGRPTNHKVYGEATAILAGDALLTFAFETVASAELPSVQIARAVRCLAEAAGPCGMVGGQIMDMAAETVRPDLATLNTLQSRKTGALIRAAAELGCIAAGVTDEEKLQACRAYAEGIGRAFQITDDILDVYGDTATLGKTVGSDAEEGKTTFMSYMSRKEAEETAALLTETAKSAISPYEGAELLCAFADMMLKREN